MLQSMVIKNNSNLKEKKNQIHVQGLSLLFLFYFQN